MRTPHPQILLDVGELSPAALMTVDQRTTPTKADSKTAPDHGLPREREAGGVPLLIDRSNGVSKHTQKETLTWVLEFAR
jgi:hypothetical protein